MLMQGFANLNTMRLRSTAKVLAKCKLSTTESQSASAAPSAGLGGTEAALVPGCFVAAYAIGRHEACYILHLLFCFVLFYFI